MIFLLVLLGLPVFVLWVCVGLALVEFIECQTDSAILPAMFGGIWIVAVPLAAIAQVLATP